MKYLAIAGIVLLLIFGAWALLKGRTPKLPYVAGSSPYRAGGGPGEGEPPDKSGQGVMPPEDWQAWWGSLDAANEAGTKAIGRVLEDLSVRAPGAIIRWRRANSQYHALETFDIGRPAIKSEADRSPALPGFIIPTTGISYVPIEVTWPYSFLTYDKEKFLVMISSPWSFDKGSEDVPVEVVAAVAQTLIVWDRKNRKFLPDISSVGITHQGRGETRENLWNIMSRTLVGMQFEAMPRGRHAEASELQLYSYPRDTKSSKTKRIFKAGRIAEISYGETMNRLRLIPVETFA